jgi:ABC-type multidrug transport system ATPase subunit
LINILTGIYQCTHGSVYISGLDVYEDFSLVQQSIGVCPQADLLWDDLTAVEHMKLHAGFKGIQKGLNLDNAVTLMLSKVGLSDRRDSYAKDFSGGMKRRLAVAMSAVGEVDAIFLDEPTTGLDPLSRRHVWDVVNWLKLNKVVLLTTHNMEEGNFILAYL